MRFGRLWWWGLWYGLEERFRGRALRSPKRRRAKVDFQLLSEAIELLARSAQLEQVDKALGANKIDAVARSLNAALPWARQLDLQDYTLGLEWLLPEAEVESFRARLASTLGVRPMGGRERALFGGSSFSTDPHAEGELSLEREHGGDEDAPRRVESWLRLPSPSTTYDLDQGLGDPRLPAYVELRDELYTATLAALRDCTQPDEWIYAVDEPEGGSSCFRLWPHRLRDDWGWRISPVSTVDDYVFVARDFSWGMYATWSFDDAVDSALSVFGQPLLDAFSSLRPRALEHMIRIDGARVEG